MPRHAAAISCSAEVRAELLAISRSRTQEARMVERARIILACLEGKENQQVAAEQGVSLPTVGKWRRRFAAARIGSLGWSHGGRVSGGQRSRGLACVAARRNLPATVTDLVCEYRSGICTESRRGGGPVLEPAAQCAGVECG